LKATLDKASKKREAFRQDSLQAWEAFCASGQYVEADQADAWLAQLEQGKNVALIEGYLSNTSAII
jgi:predicted transcriptional regulator